MKQKLKTLYTTAKNDASQEEELLRQALMKISEIRSICNERRLQARNGGNRETFHRGALMKMLQVSAQTLPLWVGKPGTKAPPLCGAVPADSNYIAKVSVFFLLPLLCHRAQVTQPLDFIDSYVSCVSD